jgi:hypothetical protein
MYWLRMRDMLTLDYPAVQAALGEASFEVLVARYLKAHPSTRPSLNDFGRHLPAFLAAHPVEGAPWLHDLAALELARAQVFIELDTPVLAPAALQALGERFEEARLVPVAALRLLKLGWDVRARLQDPEAAPEARPVHLAVWRQGHQVFHVEVLADEAQALERVRRGALLPEVCEAFAEREAPAQAAFQAIGSWVKEGMMSGLDLADA